MAEEVAVGNRSGMDDIFKALEWLHKAPKIKKSIEDGEIVNRNCYFASIMVG